MFLALLSAAGGRHSRMTLTSLGGVLSGVLDNGSPPLQLSFPFLLPLTCVMGTHRYPVLQLESVKTQALQGEVDKMLGKGPWRRPRIQEQDTTAGCFGPKDISRMEAGD